MSLDPRRRFLYKTVPVTRAEALRRRRQQHAHIRAQIAELEREAEELHRTPLPSSRTEQRVVLPGEPDYENAPVAFNADAYQGEVEWIRVNGRKPRMQIAKTLLGFGIR